MQYRYATVGNLANSFGDVVEFSNSRFKNIALGVHKEATSLNLSCIRAIASDGVLEYSRASDMPTNPLESMRRQVWEAEDRLKKSGEKGITKTSAFPSWNVRGSVAPSMPSFPIQSNSWVAEPSSEWIAYGQRTPRLSKEASGLVPIVRVRDACFGKYQPGPARSCTCSGKTSRSHRISSESSAEESIRRFSFFSCRME
jgi:hypothetical protein